MASKKSKSSNYEQRRMRTQQIIFGVIAVIIIFSWVISFFAQ
jgi:predicted nucleic acid-binding Zn ribbon protein